MNVNRWVRRGVTSAVLTSMLTAVMMLLLPAAPASAHSELVSSSPANGARLDQAPRQVRLEFTENINLIDGGLRLLDDKGATVPAPAPTADGDTITWSMPSDLADGAYLVNWRVLSADGHPVSGAFSFGIGADARSIASTTGSSAGTAPWPVVAARFAGYLAFAVLLGVVVFVTWCSPASRNGSTAQMLARSGLVAGVVTTVAGLLVQGPYATGAGWSRMFDPDLLKETTATPFGQALLWRVALYGALFFATWMLEWLEPVLSRWLVAAAFVATAVTFAASGHGAGSGRILDLGVDTVHVLAASTWLGGLVVLAAAGRAVERRAVQQFSRLAMAAVVVLVASGVVNSLLRVAHVTQLWQTRYGVLLSVKVLLVGGTLLAAAVSRRRLHTNGSVAGSVRIEAVMTVVVLAVTAALTLTSPPATIAAPASAGAPANASTTGDTVKMKLGGGSIAQVEVTPAATRGSSIRVVPLDAEGRPLRMNRVTLKVDLPSRGIDGISIPLRNDGVGWAGRYQFPLAGDWRMTLTVEDSTLAAEVTAGNITISQ